MKCTNALACSPAISHASVALEARGWPGASSPLTRQSRFQTRVGESSRARLLARLQAAQDSLCVGRADGEQRRALGHPPVQEVADGQERAVSLGHRGGFQQLALQLYGDVPKQRLKGVGVERRVGGDPRLSAAGLVSTR